MQAGVLRTGPKIRGFCFSEVLFGVESKSKNFRNIKERGASVGAAGRWNTKETGQ